MVNTLYTGDNLYIMLGMNIGSVDLIYPDPPFNSKRTYSAPIGSKAAGASFKDMWTWADVDEQFLETMVQAYPDLAAFIRTIEGTHSRPMMAYTTYMAQRVVEMHRILKPGASVYVHIDPTASHYLKIILDAIFGHKCFRNEIIWGYRTGGVSRRWFPRKHDTLLCYGKRPADDRKTTHHPIKERIFFGSNFMGTCQQDSKGNWFADVFLRDVWDDENVKPVINISKERTGYPTQKPLALLRRIIEASSNEVDMVFDPFCGCATTCVAAQQLGRQWIGIDIESQAVNLLVDRLTDDAGMFKDFIHRTDIPKRTDISPIPPSLKIKDQLYIAQKGICNGCQIQFEKRNLEIDHIIPKSKGGGDYVENYQLLCPACNRTKSNRPMEYLLTKINKLEQLGRDQISF